MKTHVKSKSQVCRLPIDKETWTVSVVRNVHSSNPEHAFIVVEGIDIDNKIVLKRYDLFMGDKVTNSTVIVDKEYKGTPSEIEGHFNTKVLKGENTGVLYYKAWNISKDQAEGLHDDIMKDQQNPPKYLISGNTSVSGKSDGPGSVKGGHSCFSWARKKVLNIEDNAITANFPSKWLDIIALVTSKHLTGKGGEKSM